MKKKLRAHHGYGYGTVALPFLPFETARAVIDYNKSRNSKIALSFKQGHHDDIDYKIKCYALQLEQHPEILNVRKYPLHIELEVKTTGLDFWQATRKCLDVIAGALNAKQTY